MAHSARAALLVGVTALAVATTGCGSDYTPSEPVPTPSSTQATTSGPPAPTPASPSPTKDPESTPSQAAGYTGEPFATVRGSLERTSVKAEIYPVRRGETTSTVNVRFTVLAGDSQFRILEALSDHNPEIGDKGDTAPDGLRLIDPAAKKAYLPATIGDGQCLCSPATNGFTDRYTDVTVSVTFAAPAPERKTIDVLVPGFGTISDVPVL